MVGEFPAMAVREVSPKIKELKRGKDSWHGPHNDGVQVVGPKDENVAQSKTDQYHYLFEAKILGEEFIIPRPKGVWIVSIKIWVLLCSRVLVMGVVRFAHIFPIKACINKHDSLTNYGVAFWFIGDERAMHCVMGYNKHTRIEPALNCD